MKYLIFLAITLFSALFEIVFLSFTGVSNTIKFLKPMPKYKEDKTNPYKTSQLILAMVICACISYAIQLSLYNNTTVINFVKLYGLFIIILSAAMIDLRKKIIPNFLIVIGLVFRLGIYIYEIITSEDIKSIVINDAIGFAIGFVLLALVSVITKQGIGFGDAKLFGVIGLTSGSFCTYSTLFTSLLISAVISIVLLISGKKGKKESIPFGPCIALGYVVVLFLTSY